jgi:hypothetical protein
LPSITGFPIIVGVTLYSRVISPADTDLRVTDLCRALVAEGWVLCHSKTAPWRTVAFRRGNIPANWRPLTVRRKE